MGAVAVRHQFQATKRCELCGKAIQSGYVINLEGYNILVCSGLHAEIARKRWMEKKEAGLKPASQVNSIKEEPLAEGDNLLDVDGGE